MAALVLALQLGVDIEGQVPCHWKTRQKNGRELLQVELARRGLHPHSRRGDADRSGDRLTGTFDRDRSEVDAVIGHLDGAHLARDRDVVTLRSDLQISKR